MNATILFHLGLVAYAIAAGTYLGYLVQPRPLLGRLGHLALGIGFLFHGGAVALRSLALMAEGTFRFSEGLSFLAFLTVGAIVWLGLSKR